VNGTPDHAGRHRWALQRRMLVFGLAMAIGLYGAGLPAYGTSIVPFFMLMFESDDATLSATQKAQLDQLIVAEHFRGKELIITGHYDQTGSAEHRIEMSQRFAEAVKDYLVTVGLPPSTLLVFWRGDSQLAKCSVTIVPR
jgi:hypothetical protein